MNPTTAVTTGMLDVPGARLHHEVRGAGPLVALVGSPMDAASFAPLADLLATDHTVLTTDPRGVHRSPLDDPTTGSTPDLRADDLARLITHLDAGPALVLGSSGGAVTALALAASRPGLVHTVVAHEPPLTELLEDREQRRAATEEIIATYSAQGRTAAWRLFLANAHIQLPEEVFQHVFGADRDAQGAADERHFFLHEMRATTLWTPDLTALRSGPVRVVVGIGQESSGELCDLTSTALASALGVTPLRFPGGHTGFADAPEAFAGRLREVMGPAR